MDHPGSTSTRRVWLPLTLTSIGGLLVAVCGALGIRADPGSGSFVFHVGPERGNPVVTLLSWLTCVGIGLLFLGWMLDLYRPWTPRRSAVLDRRRRAVGVVLYVVVGL